MPPGPRIAQRNGVEEVLMETSSSFVVEIGIGIGIGIRVCGPGVRHCNTAP